jgi:hypothetical protein
LHNHSPVRIAQKTSGAGVALGFKLFNDDPSGPTEVAAGELLVPGAANVSVGLFDFEVALQKSSGGGDAGSLLVSVAFAARRAI